MDYQCQKKKYDKSHLNSLRNYMNTSIQVTNIDSNSLYSIYLNDCKVNSSIIRTGSRWSSHSIYPENNVSIQNKKLILKKYFEKLRESMILKKVI